MTDLTPVPALIGGVLIGAASVAGTAIQGKVPGISGVFARIFRQVPGDTLWRVVFVVGLIAGGALVFAAWPAAAAFESGTSLVRMAAAGFLVGLGTRVSGGCTSGHGVCGIGRGSPASVVATLTFMLAGAATVFFVHHVLTVAS